MQVENEEQKEKLATVGMEEDGGSGLAPLLKRFSVTFDTADQMDRVIEKLFRVSAG